MGYCDVVRQGWLGNAILPSSLHFKMWFCVPLYIINENVLNCISDGASLTQVAFLLSEASLLCGVVHINIHSPIGANTELSGPPQIAYPYPSKGNLKR